MLILGSPLPLVLKSPEKKGDGVGKIEHPHGILQVVDEQHWSVQRVASPSPRLGACTRVVDEIVDGSILSLRLIADGETYFGGIEAKRQPWLTVVHALNRLRSINLRIKS